MIADLKDAFDELGNPDFAPTARLLEILHFREDRPWPTYSKGKPMTPVALSLILKDFSVVPSQRCTTGKLQRGYALADLTPVFTRYAVMNEDKPLDTQG